MDLHRIKRLGRDGEVRGPGFDGGDSGAVSAHVEHGHVGLLHALLFEEQQNEHFADRPRPRIGDAFAAQILRRIERSVGPRQPDLVPALAAGVDDLDVEALPRRGDCRRKRNFGVERASRQEAAHAAASARSADDAGNIDACILEVTFFECDRVRQSVQRAGVVRYDELVRLRVDRSCGEERQRRAEQPPIELSKHRQQTLPASVAARRYWSIALAANTSSSFTRRGVSPCSKEYCAAVSSTWRLAWIPCVTMDFASASLASLASNPAAR